MPFSLPALETVYHSPQELDRMQSGFAPNDELTNIRCPQYGSQFMEGLCEVLGDQHLQDVTLESCDGHSIRSSKIFLAACSPYFRQVFTQHESKIHFAGITLEVLEILLVFMSQGNIDVSPRLLLDVIDAATSLQIQGFQTALSQYHTRDNKKLNIQFVVDREVLKEYAGSETIKTELPETPSNTSTLSSAEPVQATDASSEPIASLLEMSPLVTSSLGHELQPTTCNMLGNGFQAKLQSLDNILHSSTISSYDKTKKGRGCLRKSEENICLSELNKTTDEIEKTQNEPYGLIHSEVTAVIHNYSENSIENDEIKKKISAEPVQATDATSEPLDSLLEIPPLVTSTLEDELQPTTCNMLGNDFQGKLQSLDIILDSSTNSSYEKTKKGRGCTRKSEKNGCLIELNKTTGEIEKTQNIPYQLLNSKEAGVTNNSSETSIENDEIKKKNSYSPKNNQLGHPKKTELVEFQKYKRGNGSLQCKHFSIDIKRLKMEPGCTNKYDKFELPNKYSKLPVELEKLQKSEGHPRKREDHGHPSNLQNISFETKKPNSIITNKSKVAPSIPRKSEKLEVPNSQEPNRNNESLQTSSVQTKKLLKGPGQPKKVEESGLPNNSVKTEESKKGGGSPKNSLEIDRPRRVVGRPKNCQLSLSASKKYFCDSLYNP